MNIEHDPPPRQDPVAVASREQAFRFAVVCLLADGGTVERAQRLCDEVHREIDDAIPAGQVSEGSVSFDSALPGVR
jgi:hypothetical protein